MKKKGRALRRRYGHARAPMIATYSGADIARMHDDLSARYTATVKGIKVRAVRTSRRGPYDQWALYIDDRQVWSGEASSIDPLNLAGGIFEAFVIHALHTAGIVREK